MKNTRKSERLFYTIFVLGVALHLQPMRAAAVVEKSQPTIQNDNPSLQLPQPKGVTKKSVGPKKIKKRRKPTKLSSALSSNKKVKESPQNLAKEEVPSQKNTPFALFIKKHAKKIMAILAMIAISWLIYAVSYAVGFNKKSDKHKRDDEKKKRKKVANNVISTLRVKGKAQVDDDELEAIILTFDMDQAADREALKGYNYYLSVDEQSNIQVELNDDTVSLLGNDGDIRKEVRLTLSPNANRIIQDESQALNLDIKVSVGINKALTRAVGVSIPMKSILNAFECGFCCETFKDKIDSEATKFNYALSHCCQGGKRDDGTTKTVYHYYCEDCARGLDKGKCAFSSAHKIKYSTHTINLGALANQGA